MGEQEKEGDDEEKDGEEDEEAGAVRGSRAAKDEEGNVDSKKQKTNEDDYAAKKEKLHLTKLNLFTFCFPSWTLNVATFQWTVPPGHPTWAAPPRR